MSRLHSPFPTAARSRWRERHARWLIATVIATVVASLALVVQAPVAGASSSLPASNSFPLPTPDVAVVPFASDVYWFTNGALTVVDPASTPTAAPLFNLEGNPLHLTWGQFSSATARSDALTVTLRGIDYTYVGIVLSGLVPNGVYSLFYRTFGPDSVNPVCGPVEPTVALTAAFPRFQRPDADSFVASSSGRAAFLASVAGRLLDAAQFLIAVIYHFDGKVYGAVPTSGEGNSNCQPTYGIDAMRQFIIVQGK